MTATIPNGQLAVSDNRDEVIKRKHFLHYWPIMRGIHQSPVNSPHKGQWHGALVFSMICTWTNGSVNNREVSDLRCHHTNYDITVMTTEELLYNEQCEKLLTTLILHRYHNYLQSYIHVHHSARISFQNKKHQKIGTLTCIIESITHATIFILPTKKNESVMLIKRESCCHDEMWKRCWQEK